jgi:hypothetical protein
MTHDSPSLFEVLCPVHPGNPRRNIEGKSPHLWRDIPEIGTAPGVDHPLAQQHWTFGAVVTLEKKKQHDSASILEAQQWTNQRDTGLKKLSGRYAGSIKSSTPR